MANVLRVEKKLAVIGLLTEGCSIRSVERLTGVHRDTICRLLVKVGNQCRAFLDREMRNLTLEHLQLDEVWTYCGRKNARVPVEERRERYDVGDQYLWIALDQKTKLVPSFILGKRTGDMARRFAVDLAGRLKRPTPHETDPHAYRWVNPQPLTQISSDGFVAYPEAIDLAFGGRVKYGQIVKNYRNRELPGRYTPGELVGADRRPIFGDLDPYDIGTSHIERFNASLRLFVKRFNRLTLAFSRKLENLAAAVALHMAHYNYVRRHKSLRSTPAMAAGVTDRLWSLADLMEAVERVG